MNVLSINSADYSKYSKKPVYFKAKLKPEELKTILKSYSQDDQFISALKTAYKIEKTTNNWELKKTLFSTKMRKIIQSKLTINSDGISPSVTVKKGKYYYSIYDIDNKYEVARCHEDGEFL